MGEITIHRYENGSIPDEANNQLLRMLQVPWNMQRLLRERGNQLPRSQRDKVTARLTQLIQEETPDKIIELATAELVNKWPDEYSGFRPFAPEILLEMIVFFANQAEGVFKTKLNKLLWYSDFLHYRYFGVAISGARYVHLKYGPVAHEYEFFLSYLLKEEEIVSDEVFFENGSGELLTGSRRYSDQVLISSATEVMAAVGEYFRKMTSKQISEISHDEDGYTNTSMGQTISYKFADQLKVDLADQLASLSH